MYSFIKVGVNAHRAIKLGMAMRPLIISASSQTVSARITALRITVATCKYTNPFQALSPNRYWAQRMPYNPQPRTVASANRHKDRVITTLTQGPRTAEKAAVVKLMPASRPYGISTPLTRITKAVNVQITMVSRNTSTIPIMPCSTGWRTQAPAWAMDAVPMPASLVKTPLEIPVRKAITAEPMAPPVTAFGENAPTHMAVKALPILSQRRISTARLNRIYNPAAKGTISSAIFPMRFAPPKSIAPINIASPSPNRSFPHCGRSKPNSATV